LFFELDTTTSSLAQPANLAIFSLFQVNSLEELIMAKRRPLKKLAQRIVRNVKKRRAKRVARRKARRTA
jgi:hypothetical protein